MTNSLCTATTNIILFLCRHSRNTFFIVCNEVCYWCLRKVHSSHLCATAAAWLKHQLYKQLKRMFGGWAREHRFHLEVAAGQDGHPLLPLQDVDDAAWPTHLRSQRGRDRLAGPPSFGWVAYSNSRGHLNLMAWSRSWPENMQPDSSSSFFIIISVVHVCVSCLLSDTLLSALEILSVIVLCRV